MLQTHTNTYPAIHVCYRAPSSAQLTERCHNNRISPAHGRLFVCHSASRTHMPYVCTLMRRRRRPFVRRAHTGSHIRPLATKTGGGGMKFHTGIRASEHAPVSGAGCAWQFVCVCTLMPSCLYCSITIDMSAFDL